MRAWPDGAVYLKVRDLRRTDKAASCQRRQRHARTAPSLPAWGRLIQRIAVDLAVGWLNLPTELDFSILSQSRTPSKTSASASRRELAVGCWTRSFHPLAATPPSLSLSTSPRHAPHDRMTATMGSVRLDFEAPHIAAHIRPLDANGDVSTGTAVHLPHLATHRSGKTSLETAAPPLHLADRVAEEAVRRGVGAYRLGTGGLLGILRLAGPVLYSRPTHAKRRRRTDAG